MKSIEGECPIKMGGIRWGLVRVSHHPPSPPLNSQLGLISSETKPHLPLIQPLHTSFMTKISPTLSAPALDIVSLFPISLHIAPQLFFILCCIYRMWMTDLKKCSALPSTHINHLHMMFKARMQFCSTSIIWGVIPIQAIPSSRPHLISHCHLNSFEVMSSAPTHLPTNPPTHQCHRNPPTLRPSSVPCSFNAGRQKTLPFCIFSKSFDNQTPFQQFYWLRNCTVWSSWSEKK